MAKTPNKPSAGRDRGTANLKSVPAAPARSAAKAPPAKPVPKAPPPSAKPVAKSPPPKTPAPKPAAPAKKATPAAALPPRSPVAKTKSSKAEQSPATEAEIMGAVSGKLAARTGGSGMSWLGSRPRTPAEEPKAEVVAVLTEETIAPVAVEMPETPPPPAAAEVVVEEVIISVSEPVGEEPVAAAVESTDVAAPVAEDAPATESFVASEPEVIAPPVEPPASPVLAEPVTAPPKETVPAPAAFVPASKETLSQTLDKGEALSVAFKTALHQAGWVLALQGLLFVGFAVLVKGGAPLHGLAYFLAGAIPLAALGLIVAAVMSMQRTQQVLERLESDRRRYHQMLSLPEGQEDSLTNLRKAVFWPAQAVLGVLFLVWFVMGLNVWFL